MKLLCNENISTKVVEALRARGHDVLAVKETFPGAGDSSILARANEESRLVITQDKDFGELAFRWGLQAGCGILLFRLTLPNPDAERRRMLTVIEDRTDWAGQFAVATDDRVRMRPLPPSRG
jgi:predicted nuclease of predicted toxin-antitoxin system